MKPITAPPIPGVTSDNAQFSEPTNPGRAGSDSLQLTARSGPTLGLPARLDDYIGAAISKSSRRAYGCDLRHFWDCGGTVPATPAQIAAYVSQGAGNLKPATLRRRLASIGRAHTAQGMQNPCSSDLVRTVMRGVRRTHGAAQRQVRPVEPDQLRQICAGLTGVKGQRDRALLLLGFLGAFRRSELVGLRVADLDFVSQGLVVTLRRSKTDQEGQGRRIAIPVGDSDLCAVKAVRDWLSAAAISEGPILRAVTRAGRIGSAALSDKAVALIVKRLLQRIGIDATEYSGHSLRAGFVTAAARAGARVDRIKAQSGHASDAMVARYVRDATLFDDNAAAGLL